MTKIQVPQSVLRNRRTKGWIPSPWKIDFDSPFDELTLTRTFSKVTMTLFYDMRSVWYEMQSSMEFMFTVSAHEPHTYAMDISDMLSMCHDAMVSVLLYACTPTGTKIRLTEKE